MVPGTNFTYWKADALPQIRFEREIPRERENRTVKKTGKKRKGEVGRIVFKLCLIIFKCRHQTVPEYLQELCVPVTASTSRHHLRSAARGNLQVLACRTSTFGSCSYAACAPKLWNSLPSSLRDPTHLFSKAYGRALVTA